MKYYPFPAQLLSCYNSTSVFGHASVSPDGRSLDFTGEFIPLLPLGEGAVIHWILGDKILATLTGTVYLSSKNLLRLVDVPQKKLEALKEIFYIQTNLPCTLWPADEKHPSARRREPPLQAEILYMSREWLKLHTGGYVAEGSRLLIDAEAEFLTLRALPVLVRQRVLVSRKNALLICECCAQELTDDNLIALATYAARLEKQGEAGRPE